MLGIWSIVLKVNTLLLNSFLQDPSYTWADGDDGEDLVGEEGIANKAKDSDLNHLAIIPFDPPTICLDEAEDCALSSDDDPV